MSLPEAVKDIAQQMEGDASGKDTVPALMLSFYAKMLQSAVKAAEGVQTQPQILTRTNESANIDPATHHRQMIERAKMEMRTKAQEGVGGGLVEVVGGGLDATMVEAPVGMPVGAKTMLGKQVYELGTDGRLHYCQEDTIKQQK